jgi:hypothetical protein
MDFKDTVKKKLEEWKADIESLQVTLHLGKADASDEFEKQKTNLSKWLKEAKEKMTDLTEEKANDLKAKMEELELQAALGKADGADELKKQQKNINHAIHNLKKSVKESYGKSGDKKAEFSEFVDQKLDHFHTQFDIFRLHFHLGKKDGQEVWDEKKAEMETKLKDLNKKVDELKDSTLDTLEDLSDNVSKVWTDFTGSLFSGDDDEDDKKEEAKAKDSDEEEKNA